jgi:CRISPR-associated protein Csh2
MKKIKKIREANKMNNRVYGIIGIKSIMANWNADFSGYPKSISTGEVFGSDKAVKYPMKRMWQDKGKKVLNLKSLKFDEKSEKKDEKKEFRPRSLKERYEYLFGIEDLKKENDSRIVYKNLFSTIDVKNFGATFAEEGNNISIMGAVQFGQGFNKYKDTAAEEQQILSPFRDPKSKDKDKDKEEAKSTTLGTKIVSNEAHYFYPFVVNARAYDEYVLMGVTEGYTMEDYLEFKEVALTSATAFNSNSKMGCENELAVFATTKEDFYLPDLSQYVTFEKGESMDIIKFGFSDLMNKLGDGIETVEIYYNTLTTIVQKDIAKAKYFNIFTREEV